VTTTIGSNVLTSIGSILPDLDHEDNFEMDHIGLGLGYSEMEMGLGRTESARTVLGQESGEGSDLTSPAPAYHSLEMGFSIPQPTGVLGSVISGIKVDVEKTTM
jgi:hypothetical protein